jgi:hypothetical protein
MAKTEPWLPRHRDNLVAKVPEPVIGWLPAYRQAGVSQHLLTLLPGRYSQCVENIVPFVTFISIYIFLYPIL